MTQGTVAILGVTGANVGAGMTGGIVFVRKDQQSNLNDEYVTPVEMDAEQIELLRRLLSAHAEATGSAVAQQLLDAESDLRTVFVACVPNAVAATTDARSGPQDPAVVETRQ